MKVLGIETSCDETALAIYDGGKGLLAHELYSQARFHSDFGGVVPELASRDHVRKILPLLDCVLKSANISEHDLDGIAYTAGPGLAGSLMVGGAVATSLAFTLDIPVIGVHHMEAHLLSSMLEKNSPEMPFLALLVSGGHTQIVNVKSLGNYELLGESLDDAAGEAFDKVAKLLELGYPGGPIIGNLAEKGDWKKYYFPRPMSDRPGLDFSFSGLKTHTRNLVNELDVSNQEVKYDLCAGFQEAIVDTLIVKCSRALKQTSLKSLVVAGGVSANTRLRFKMREKIEKMGVHVFYSRLEFCTDNGAMIAYLGHERLKNGDRGSISIETYPRWPMEDLTQLQNKT
tara:strand:+ start:1131 stop:2159 length:1029 start_codon:yes stop_codon:yes gene_type:complete